MKETKKAVARTAAKTETVKTEAVKAEKAVKAAVAKTESTVKAAAEKAESTVKAAAEKAAPAAKATTTKAAATAKKTTKAVAKPATRKAAVKETITVQFAGKSYSSEELVKIAKDVWEYDLNQKAADFKTVELFVKPEESTVYYVINEDVRGSFRI